VSPTLLLLGLLAAALKPEPGDDIDLALRVSALA
jgi:hypothetical protein